ncbi:GH1 family beta-glucosidase [Paenibacillus woosongensis]|uniref:Beta-glucosidase n=1 Tax=Paenibacillus woosongensis TaxID=307580 RepID=A0ABQ4MVT6_9BACL|nr:GH1 family beta-glucosidase [Paenibacillus woosongensis]GIP60032.1 beta-glucosidase [Paenibacillus woosongensis]
MTIIQFPENFVWGVSTSAYQIEGSLDKDGRGPSIWDVMAATPGKIYQGDDASIACDSYNRYEEDIQLMKELGVKAYRFSVSWPRIYPNGFGEVNRQGIEHYKRMVTKLLENGIEPFCTLYHWELPQALQELGGWENRETIDAFVMFAETMFREFDGLIKHWMTFNEPWCTAINGHLLGRHAPCIMNWQSAIQVGHHLLVAHGKTVAKFRELGTAGEIGYAPDIYWYEPFSRKQEDIDAAYRAFSIYTWFVTPVFTGKYPEEMAAWIKTKGAEPVIEPGDMEIISQKIDFLGLNFYGGNIVRHKEGNNYLDLEHVDLGYDKSDKGWFIFPEGLYLTLSWLTEQFGPIPIYITENGACYNDEVVNGKVNDVRRIKFLESHIAELGRAIESGVNLKGYLTWSLMDNFEWAFGYSCRFGLIHVDYRTQVRTPKESYYWYQKLIRKNWLELESR